MSSNARSRRLPPARINHRNSPPRSTTSTSFNPDWWYRRIALRITESGRSVLRALEGLREPSLDFPSGSASHSLKLIDNLIGTEERLKIFNLEIRAMNEGVDFGAVQDEEDLKPTMPESPAPAPEIGVDDPLKICRPKVLKKPITLIWKAPQQSRLTQRKPNLKMLPLSCCEASVLALKYPRKRLLGTPGYFHRRHEHPIRAPLLASPFAAGFTGRRAPNQQCERRPIGAP
jgi:hypothetical protein